MDNNNAAFNINGGEASFVSDPSLKIDHVSEGIRFEKFYSFLSIISGVQCNRYGFKRRYSLSWISSST